MARSNQFLRQGLFTVFAVSTSGIAMALTPYVGPPVAYDGWTVDSGQINTTSSCSSATVTCQVLAQDPGFVQQKIIDHVKGVDFIRVIVTDPNVSGTGVAPGSLGFTYENYIRFATQSNSAGIGNGMAGKTVIRDAAQGLDLTVLQQRGEMRGNWAGSSPYMLDPQAWSIKIMETLTDPSSTLAFNQGFDMTQYTYSGGCGFSADCDTELGKIIHLSSTVGTDASGDRVRFEHERAKGYYGLWATPPWFSNPIVKANATGVTLGGTTVTWAAGADLAISWIGSTAGLTPAPNAGQFGWEKITNATTGITAKQVSAGASGTTTGPFTWISTNPWLATPTASAPYVFGSAPVF